MQFRRSVNHAAGLTCQPCTRAVPWRGLTMLAVAERTDRPRSVKPRAVRSQQKPALGGFLTPLRLNGLGQICGSRTEPNKRAHQQVE